MAPSNPWKLCEEGYRRIFSQNLRRGASQTNKCCAFSGNKKTSPRCTEESTEGSLRNDIKYRSVFGDFPPTAQCNLRVGMRHERGSAGETLGRKWIAGLRFLDSADDWNVGIGQREQQDETADKRPKDYTFKHWPISNWLLLQIVAYVHCSCRHWAKVPFSDCNARPSNGSLGRMVGVHHISQRPRGRVSGDGGRRAESA